MNGLFPFESQVDYPPMIVDSFAGGGGASTGIEMALGRSPDIAINHNPAALALHAANHPDTLHLSENVWQVDPLDYVKDRHVGLAWFSPDCKHFSKAKGGKPVERNIRDLAWVVVLWAERVRPDVILLENVEEFRDWGPLREEWRGGPNGEKKLVLMPDPDQRGATFAKWAKQLRRLGYRLEHRELRACDYGAPTIRRRLFLIARCDGRKIVWPKPTHGRPDDPDVIAGRKKPWRTAAEIIDWSLPCPSIFDTTDEVFSKHGLRAVRPLASATMSRVARGVKRYVLDARRPFLVDVAHGEVSPSGVKRWGQGHRSLDDPLSVVTAGGINHAVIAPSVIRHNSGATGHDMREPLATVTANSFIKRPGGAAPLGVIAPVLAAYYGKGEGSDDRSASPNEPVRTVVTENRHALVVPSLVGCGGRAGQSRPRGGDEPAATVTAKADVCVTAAFLAQHNNDARRVGGVNPGRPADEPMSTITQAPQQAVVSAHLLSMKGSDRRDRPADEPHATVCAEGQHSAVVVPHLMTMRNAAKPFNGADEPTHTVTAGGAGLSLVAPFVTKYYGVEQESRHDEPLHTATSKARFGHVESDLHPEPLTDAQLERARWVADFLREHGFWDEREFVTVDLAGEAWTIVDIGMRMLTPRELFSAQGFPPDYVIDLDHDGRPLSKSDQIACCGNSVCPPLAAALVAANCDHLAVYREAAE